MSHLPSNIFRPPRSSLWKTTCPSPWGLESSTPPVYTPNWSSSRSWNKWRNLTKCREDYLGIDWSASRNWLNLSDRSAIVQWLIWTKLDTNKKDDLAESSVFFINLPVRIKTIFPLRKIGEKGKRHPTLTSNPRTVNGAKTLTQNNLLIKCISSLDN